MTLLVGVATRKGVWIGADSGSVAGAYAVRVPEPKVWKTSNGWIVGGCGDWRALELVKYTVQFPDPPKSVNEAHRTIAVDVVDEINKALEARGFSEEPEDDGSAGWTLMLATRCASRAPVLFHLEDEHPEQHRSLALGAGEEYALGVLSQNAHLSPERRVRATLNATRKHYGILLPPYRIESL